MPSSRRCNLSVRTLPFCPCKSPGPCLNWCNNRSGRQRGRNAAAFWQSQSSALRSRSGLRLETTCLFTQSTPTQKTLVPLIRLSKVTSALGCQMWRSKDGKRLPTCPHRSVHSSVDVILILRYQARSSITTPVSSPCVSLLRRAIKNGTAVFLNVVEFSSDGTAPNNNV